MNDFEVIKINMHEDGTLQYRYIKVNIEDAGEEGLYGKLEAIFKELEPKFE